MSSISNDSIQNADIFYLSQKIFKVTEELGKIEGEARERGYPELSVAKAADCRMIFFSHIGKEDLRLKEMQRELGIVYQNLVKCGHECRDLNVPEIKAVFDRQIEQLHEKRGVLNRSLQGFEELVRTHLLLGDVKGSIRELEVAIGEYEGGEREIEGVHPLRDRLEMLWLKLGVIFPDGKRDGGSFCQIHFEEKRGIDLEMQKLKLRLNASETARRERENVAGKLHLGVLLSILDVQRASHEGVDSSFAKAFSSLPLMFRYEVVKQAGLLSEEMEVDADHYFHLTDRLAQHRQGTELWGTIYHHHHRMKEEFANEIDALPGEKGQERERLRVALEEGIARRMDEVVKDLMGARRAFEGALELFPALEPEGFKRAAAVEEVLKAFEGRSVKSFDQLKKLITEAGGKKSILNGATERVLESLLAAAEKGGLDLGADRGLYYWVWWLAHEKDSRAGGNNFGKMQAPKDIERLLEAVEKVLPSAEAVVKRLSGVQCVSLTQLKEEVAEVCGLERFSGIEKEKCFEALLSEAEKGGVPLGGPKGVYYWIWFIAHESDPKAGGSQFGKLQAPKDGARLLAAIERAMQGV